jgi:plastocyanin
VIAGGTKYCTSLAALTVMLVGVCPEAASPQGGAPAEVRGRVEIRNPRVRLRDGRADASGVAVWLIPVKADPKPGAAATARVIIEQKDKRFVPHVTVVQVGTEVDFPNYDPFFHNVFSTFDGKTFDLGLYANGESRPVQFNRPGISFVYCNIHPQMSAVIVTVDTPFFATSVPDGTFSIRSVPAGSYELHVWHERSDRRQLESQKRIVPVDSRVTDLGVIRLDESAYISTTHKNKHGEDYPVAGEPRTYRRP